MRPRPRQAASPARRPAHFPLAIVFSFPIMAFQKLKQTMKTDWQIDTAHLINRHQAKTLARRYPTEIASCMKNLGKVVDELESGTSVSRIPFSFFRSEVDGVFRIGQTGVPSAREMRLYVTFAFIAHVAYILAIGTKNTQPRDIADARRIAKTLRKEAP